MPKKKVEVYNKDQLIYPYIESDHVTFSNGMKVSEMLDQGISMPTVTHEETSFKVGVGDSDVSSSIVDSSVSKMVIKGQTYQNILPEPSTHILTNNKEMFKVNEGLDPNVEIVDGVSKSAILKGQTLVNLVANPTHTFTQTSTINETWKQVNKYFTVDLQVGKTYIALWDMTWTNAAYTPTATAFCFRNKDNQGVGRYSQLPSGKYYCKVTIDGSVPTPTMFRFHTSLGTGIENTLTVSNFIVLEYQEGMENWIIPYFEGMKSVKMPVLTTTGKNLFKPFRTYTTKGLTFTITDGQLYVDGTATDTVDYYLTTKGSDGGMYDLINNNIPAGTTLTLSNNLGLRNHFGYYLDGVEKDYWANESLAIESNTSNIRCFVRFQTGQSFSNQPLNIQLEQGTVATSYEPYRSNILHTPEEVVLRSLPNGIKDTLNLMTGEYVQRIGEITFNGSETGWDGSAANNNTFRIRCNVGYINNTTIHAICKEYESRDYQSSWDTGKFISVSLDKKITFRNDNIPQGDTTSWKAYLQANPITVQYVLETPTIKIVDLSSSGNWEKIVLDGSENWARHGNYGSVTRFNVTISNMAIGHYHVFSDKFPRGTIGTNDLECVNNHYSANQFQLQIKTSRLTSDSVDGLKQYLSQNPLTALYQTKTHLDSTQVKQPIFFKDGHIIQSSVANNSLIPTLDYQAKTSNSYVMDLMKPNTRYTMKAKSASGTFTIDGTSYGAGTNGTFTTPSSMTNKFLVMSNKTNTEVMILEGDVTSKTIPYFKGIKSAFEGEDKIEVLSTGKNLFDINLIYGAHTYGNIGQKPSHGTGYARVTNETGDYILVKPNTKYTFSIGNNFSFAIAQLDKDGISLGDTGWLNNKSSWTITTQSTARYVGFNIRKLDDSDITPDEVYKAYPMFEESLSATTYEPYKSNSTKIPLLSPLRSLPNGVCDEIILDRENNKATLIQRVGELIHYGQGGTVTVETKGEYHKYGFYGLIKPKQNSYSYNSVLMCDTFMWNDNIAESQGEKISSYKHSTGTELRYAVSPHKAPLLTENYFRDWLSQNPVTVYYELETPVITEVDLEGFPYIYKDGHIFLNGEITPTTEIIYSINQCQQISASNEDIIRHEKELTYLQKLIAQYVQVDYESALLSLKV